MKTIDALFEVAEKFAESDWERNRGRFANYIGRGGSGGRAGGGGKEESGVATVGGTKIDLSKISDPDIRADAMEITREHLRKFPSLQGYVQEIRVEDVDTFEGAKFGPMKGTMAMRLDPDALTPEGLEALRKQANDGELGEAWARDPLRALVSHEIGHAVEDRLLERWRENPAGNLDTYMAIERTRDKRVSGRYQDSSVMEHWAEAFAERQTLLSGEWSPGAKAVDEVVRRADVKGWW